MFDEVLLKLEIIAIEKGSRNIFFKQKIESKFISSPIQNC